MPVKPPRSSPTDSTGVVIPNKGMLIEYDAVALELVLLAHGNPATHTMVEHRSLAPSPPWAGRDGEGRSGSKGGEGSARSRWRLRWSLRAGPGPRCAEDCGEAFRPMARAVPHAVLLGRWAAS